jgi:hypothetical protein
MGMANSERQYEENVKVQKILGDFKSNDSRALSRISMNSFSSLTSVLRGGSNNSATAANRSPGPNHDNAKSSNLPRRRSVSSTGTLPKLEQQIEINSPAQSRHNSITPENA